MFLLLLFYGIDILTLGGFACNNFACDNGYFFKSVLLFDVFNSNIIVEF